MHRRCWPQDARDVGSYAFEMPEMLVEITNDDCNITSEMFMATDGRRRQWHAIEVGGNTPKIMGDGT